MVEIELNNGQIGYEEVAKYIRRYWEHNVPDNIIVHLLISYDGNRYEDIKEIAYPTYDGYIEFLYDWWEGQRFIKLLGIKTVRELDVHGGIYEDK